jgi:hypothetical protein
MTNLTRSHSVDRIFPLMQRPKDIADEHFLMRATPMLAEKFILYLESLLKSQSHPDGSPRVVSTSPHVPVKLPRKS